MANRIGNVVVDMGRDDSIEQDQIVEAINKARPNFAVVKLDMETIRDGRVIKYWSLNSLRKAVAAPLAKCGVQMQSAFKIEDGVPLIVCSLTHTSGQRQVSVQKVKDVYGLSEIKGVATQQAKPAFDGLLQVITEQPEEDDVIREPVSHADPNAQQHEKLQIAKAKLASCQTRQEAASILDLANKRIDDGSLPSDCMKELHAIAEEKFPTNTEVKNGNG
jgi:hypothetical protein